MPSTPAQYLVRFDDLCPTMLSDRRERFLSIIDRYRVKPVLAIVPDNQDPALNLQATDPGFWDRMRSLEAAGATIAMHGYRHLCTNRGRSLLRLHEETEFAGVDEALQRQWIRSGLEILRGHGLSPRLFVAPRHGFDHATLRALAREGLGILSDGFARRPFSRGGILWIPQQLWEPVLERTGLWTICIHTNTASYAVEGKLEKFLRAGANQFTTFDSVIAETYPGHHLYWNERLEETMANLRIRFSGGRSRQNKPPEPTDATECPSVPVA
jgi:predicted deacetylase